MVHGNKKYFFDKLEKIGDEIIVEPKNIYSLKNQARLYIKETDETMKFDFEDHKGGKVSVKRVA